MSNDWNSWFEEIQDARSGLAGQAERVHLKLVQDFGKVVLKSVDHYQESSMASRAIQCNYVLSRNQELESEQYQASSNDR